MDEQKGHVSNLLENTWFFGNTLNNNKSKLPNIMVRSNSDPCPSSTTMEKTLVSQDDHNPLNMSNTLRRAPSLPTFLGKDEKCEHIEEEEDDYEPRMGDLIRQAMPIQVVSSRRLDRMSSLPSCKGANEVLSVVSNVKKGSKLSEEVSVESSGLLQEKSPIAMTKLSRRASMEPSLLLPPKYTPKGTKQNPSNSKNRPVTKKDSANKNSPVKIDSSKIQTMTKSKSHKSLRNIESEELQGFKDLGFSFNNNNNDVSSNNVTQVLPRLQRGASLDSKVRGLRRPNVSEAWQQPSPPLSAPPSGPKPDGPKAELSQNMKAQIKFWARAVASNVRQEC